MRSLFLLIAIFVVFYFLGKGIVYIISKIIKKYRKDEKR